MKIVVTGGTGFVGVPLVRRLVAAGHEVAVWTRNPERAARVLPARCRPVAGGSEAAGEALRGADAVVHLAGESVAGGRWTRVRKHNIRASRVEGTRALLDRIAALAPEDRPRALVSASAIGIYGDRGDERLDEQSAPGEGFLAEVCTAWEAAAARAGDLGLRCAVVRIGVVLGRGGGALAKVLPPFRLGLGGNVGSGRQWMSWIHLDDLVRLLERAAVDPRVRGVLNGVAPEPATNAAFTAVLASTVSRIALLPLPAFALRLAFGEMSSVLLASQRVLPVAATALGFSFRYPTLPLALGELCSDDATEGVWEQWVPAPPDAVFPFFADARNLERITPPFLRFSVRAVRPETLGDGTQIDYRLRLHGVPLRWASVIESWQPGCRFVDRQIAGPYALWHHTHEFEPLAGGTLLRDRVRYALPLGALGELVAGAFVARDVERIFAFRRAAIAELFGAASPGGEARRPAPTQSAPERAHARP